MKLTAKVKLLPTPEQRGYLLDTLRRFNAACNYISDVAWETRTFKQIPLHHWVYHTVKDRFDLSAQMAVRANAKVVDAYKLDRQKPRSFRELGAITYDDRVLSWKLTASTVSIWTLQGRQTIPFAAGEYQRRLLRTRQRETDLAYVGGEFYLFATVNVEEPEPVEVKDVLGVDLGIVNIATDSDGETYSGSHLNSVRHRHRRLRRRLQKKGTKGAKRRLKKLSGKEWRFANDVNHTISKRIVEKAQRTNRAVALENLKGIRQRVRVRRPQRSTLHSWAFHDLGQKLAYKAQRAGVRVVFVDPRNSSRECPCCGHAEKANRPDQSTFRCRVCGFADHADKVAALNLRVRGWAAVNPPNVGEANRVLHGSVPASPYQSPLGFGRGS
ncbi:RNA-guided endonuclease InsQ/TnpB family protein [Meiothermus hypogaeus]|uniref:Transposase, IS605 OrfB family n=1 Tax=Meiothermus hypogaeus TaxID=884155 RepID=A0ABX9MS98_9DEIN|nr:RNA-guided endonuclease TnpB family protein [Meiothermus hypogaeus]RIH79217.1 transposase, IS605 OrfB family [Meiothermus hypogaeus]